MEVICLHTMLSAELLLRLVSFINSMQWYTHTCTHTHMIIHGTICDIQIRQQMISPQKKAQSAKKIQQQCIQFTCRVGLPRLAVPSVRCTLKESLLLGRDPLIDVIATLVRSSPASRMTILVFTNPNTKEEELKCKTQQQYYSKIASLFI